MISTSQLLNTEINQNLKVNKYWKEEDISVDISVNKFEHVWRGLYSEVQVEHIPGALYGETPPPPSWTECLTEGQTGLKTLLSPLRCQVVIA